MRANTKVNVKKILCEVVNRSQLALDRDEWQAFIARVMNIPRSLELGNIMMSF
jgi:hypothetical protein